MISKKLFEIEKLSKGNIISKDYNNIIINGVSIDTRTINKKNLFIPIIGDKFDGHKFINEAIKGGASAALWNKNIPIPNIDFPFILVDDTILALQTLAKNYRNSLSDLKIVGITGSNGKTSTKDILDGILSTNFKTKKTIGNLNNHIGLPLTLLSFGEDTEIGILEMGTDGFGQIEILTNIASPDIALITNIGDSHLDLLKTKENVAKAKLEILSGLNKNGTFIYNNDDIILSNIVQEYNISNNIIKFGTKSDSDIFIELLDDNIDGVFFNIIENEKTYKLHIPMIGKHNMYNAAASISVARLLNISYKDIQKGMYQIEETDMRNEIIEKDKYTILNDAYKSNPDSLLAALETLYSIDGYEHKSVVLGDMLDLGDEIVSLHEDIGEKLDPNKISQVFTVGDLGKYISNSAKNNFSENNVFHSNTKEELYNCIIDNINDNSLILFKASRGVALEDVINKLIIE